MLKIGSFQDREAAEKAASAYANYEPYVVELRDGSYDWFPRFHPLPSGSRVVSEFLMDTWVSEWIIEEWRAV